LITLLVHVFSRNNMFSLTVRQLFRRSSAVTALENNAILKFRYVNFSQVTAPQLKPSPLEYSVEEVKVPSVGGFVAGMLFFKLRYFFHKLYIL